MEGGKEGKMSYNGDMSIEVTTHACFEEAARRWAKEHHYSVHVGSDKEIHIGPAPGEYAVHSLESEFEDFADKVSDLAIPPSEWKACVWYRDYETDQDGAEVFITIENGKIASFEESRFQMVEVRPWLSFELKSREQ